MTPPSIAPQPTSPPIGRRPQGPEARRRARREALIARSAVLRERLAPHLDRADALALKVLQARELWRWAQTHRQTLVTAAAVAGLAFGLLRPGRAWRLARLGWSLWRTWLRLKAVRAGTTPSPAAPAVPAPVWLSGLRFLLSLRRSAR